jgi:hypothetical protein
MFLFNNCYFGINRLNITKYFNFVDHNYNIMIRLRNFDETPLYSHSIVLGGFDETS